MHLSVVFSRLHVCCYWRLVQEKTAGTTTVRRPLKASEFGRAEVVRSLLEAGAATDSWDNSCMTALMPTSRHGHLKATDLMLQAGADTECRQDSPCARICEWSLGSCALAAGSWC